MPTRFGCTEIQMGPATVEWCSPLCQFRWILVPSISKTSCWYAKVRNGTQLIYHHFRYLRPESEVPVGMWWYTMVREGVSGDISWHHCAPPHTFGSADASCALSCTNVYHCVPKLEGKTSNSEQR